LSDCVVIPARNEEESIPSLINSLASQCGIDGEKLDHNSFEVILLLNNCTDRSAEVARAMQEQYSELNLHISEVSYSREEAHVGRARQALFDAAFGRFHFLNQPRGLILTTDADSRPAPDWIAQTRAEIARGLDGVGGRVLLDPVEAALLPVGVRRLFLLDIAYRHALEELRSIYAPQPHDPFPRHHQHFGASLAVTAQAYLHAGGMPLCRSNEDVALHRAIINSGGRFRHSYRVRVYTSGRMNGRAQGGLSDAINWWNRQALESSPVLVESAASADARLGQLGLWTAEYPDHAPPPELVETPEPPPFESRAEIHLTIRTLREICESLRPLTLCERLEKARKRPLKKTKAPLQS
jgi:glycosyltransferase involved in cell wall biosynthesis